MGIIDKIRGNKKDNQADANTDDLTDKRSSKRSSSLSRKKGSKVAGSDEVEPLPVITEPTTAKYDDTQGTSKEADDLSKDLEKVHVGGQLDEKNLSSVPFDKEAFFADSVSTTAHDSTQKAAVVQEVVQKHIHEVVTPVFHREHHVTHHQTRIQPVLEQTMLPAKHYVIIDGQKHEILPEAVMNHIVVARDWIPMNVKPEIIVREYVGSDPVLGPISGTGASMLNKDVMQEHQSKLNTAHEAKAAGREHSIPAGQITHVNYLPNQIPVSTEAGKGPSGIAATTNPLSTGTAIVTPAK